MKQFLNLCLSTCMIASAQLTQSGGMQPQEARELKEGSQDCENKINMQKTQESLSIQDVEIKSKDYKDSKDEKLKKSLRVSIISELNTLLQQGELKESDRTKALDIAHVLKAHNLKNRIEMFTTKTDLAFFGLPLELRMLIVKKLMQGEDGIKNIRNLIETNKAFAVKASEAVESLDISSVSNKVTDQVLVNLVELFPNIQILNLTDCDITDDGLDYIKSMKNLTELNLTWSTVRDTGLAYIMNMPLTSLNLEGCYITDTGLVYISNMENLKKLVVSGGHITDTGLDYISNMALTSLDLTGCDKITDASLGYIKNMKNLKELTLAWSDITDTGLASIMNMPLTSLNLCDCDNITDAGLEHIKNMKNLKELNLSDCNITDIARQKLQQSMPNLKIIG